MDPTPFRAACVQTNSGREIADNLRLIEPLVRDAAADGAVVVLLPENVSMLEPDPARLRQKAFPEDTHPALAGLRELAQRNNVWLLIGSIAIREADVGITNRSFLVDATGGIVARYDKVHLFDVDLGNGERYQESATFMPGREAVVAETPWGGLGLSICYDLRFPRLYRHLARSGASLLSIPAAFTRTTGQAHWNILVRARAIENGCFVFAPAQCGTHAEGRETFGHSMIVDPWGTVLAEADDDPGYIVADIDPAAVADARRRIPSLAHEVPL